jgi:hypothetical protein
VEIVLDILFAAVVFGALATTPLLMWFGAAWLLNDRRRAPSDRSAR